MARFLSSEWVAAFDAGVRSVPIAAPAEDAGLGVLDGTYATALIARPASGTAVAVTVRVTDGHLTLTEGADADAGATVRATWEDAQGFLAGTWDPGPALAGGGAQVRGDLAVLRATGDVLRAVHHHVASLLSPSDA
jgi:hypothetical protein